MEPALKCVGMVVSQRAQEHQTLDLLLPENKKHKK